MQLRGTMILVLVVWLLMGWVRSQEGGADTISRQRRSHQRRMTMKKLAARGLSRAEQERMAEEILARLDSYSRPVAAATTTTTTSTTTTPPHLLHHRHRHHHQLRPFDLHLSPRAARLAEELVDERPPEPSNLRYSQEFLGFEDPEAETELLAEEEEEMEVEEEEDNVIEEYRKTENLDDLTRGKRERATAEERRRQSRKNRRNERRGECRKRRERCKQLRKSVRRRRRRRDREVKQLVNNDTIKLHEDDYGTKYIDCCPSVLVIMNKTNGKSRDHVTMDIKPGHQVFTERLCMKGFENKECIIPAGALKPEVSTRCVQQYSYSQAITRLKDTDDEWKVGSIQVGSGCSCQVSINHKKKKRKRKKR